MGLPDPEEALAKARGAHVAEEKSELLGPTTLIDIDVKDARGERYTGTFFYKVPTLGQQVEIGKMKNMYLPTGSGADVSAATVVEVICYLTVCITFNDKHAKPKWWNPMEAYNLDPYSALFGRCLDYEARFHGKGANPGADEGELREEEKPPGDDQVRVGGEVQPAPKRRETLAGDGA